jgi:hypothetical protein
MLPNLPLWKNFCCKSKILTWVMNVACSSHISHMKGEWGSTHSSCPPSPHKAMEGQTKRICDLRI